MEVVGSFELFGKRVELLDQFFGRSCLGLPSPAENLNRDEVLILPRPTVESGVKLLQTWSIVDESVGIILIRIIRIIGILGIRIIIVVITIIIGCGLSAIGHWDAPKAA